MKTRRKIVLICLIVIFVFYVSVTSLGPGSVFALFSPASILYLPSISMQLIANEGNGIICVDACGPCSAWGYQYILIDGQCMLPSVESCKLLDQSGEWVFDEWTCKPVCEREHQENCVDVGNLPHCTSDRTACFNQETNLCDPSGWECDDAEEIFEEIIENEK